MNQEQAKALLPELTAEFWTQGEVAFWYCKPKQQSVIDFIRATDDPFFEASRRFGKTTSVLAWDIEESIRRPIVTRWCEPWKNQCREIVMTEMDKIQSFVPNRYRFDWKNTDSFYQCRWNDSRIYLRGVNEDRGESARGTAAHIIVADELGSWREPFYIITEVLGPQLLTTRGKLVYMGTPPRNMAHLFYEIKDLAVTEKRFVQRLIHDQEIVTWEEVEKAIKRAGGWSSAAVKREYLCEKITDPKFAIIPEWDDKYIEAIDPDEFFPFYLKYDGLDIGVRDLTVCLIGYYDFKRAKLVIIDEIVLNGPEMTTEKLAEAIRAKEAEYFGVKWEQTVENGRQRWRLVAPKTFRMRRVSDIDLLLVNDMSLLHGLYFEPTDKGHLEEMVNEVRLWVGGDRLVMHPRCINTIDCLRYGLWDEDRKLWERSDRLGHFDALAALMYLIRNVDVRSNPIPSDYGKPEDDWFYDKNVKTERRDKLKKMLNIK